MMSIYVQKRTSRRADVGADPESVSSLTFILSLAPIQAASGGDAGGGGRLRMFAVISFIDSDVLKARQC